MDVNLKGRHVVAIMGIVAMETIAACVAFDRAEKATKKAREKSWEAAIYKFSNYVNSNRVEKLEKENAKLKS